MSDPESEESNMENPIKALLLRRMSKYREFEGGISALAEIVSDNILEGARNDENLNEISENVENFPLKPALTQLALPERRGDEIVLGDKGVMPHDETGQNEDENQNNMYENAMHLQQKLDPLMKVVEISADSVADKAPNIDIANIGIANIDYVSNTNNIDAIGEATREISIVHGQMLLKPEDVIFPARVRRQDQIMHDNQSFNKIHANVLGNKRYPRKENYILQRALPQRAGENPNPNFRSLREMNISDDSVADYGMGFTEIVHAPAEIAIIPGCGNLEHGDHKNVSKTFVDFGVHVENHDLEPALKAQLPRASYEMMHDNQGFKIHQNALNHPDNTEYSPSVNRHKQVNEEIKVQSLRKENYIPPRLPGDHENAPKIFADFGVHVEDHEMHLPVPRKPFHAFFEKIGNYFTFFAESKITAYFLLLQQSKQLAEIKKQKRNTFSWRQSRRDNTEVLHEGEFDEEHVEEIRKMIKINTEGISIKKNPFFDVAKQWFYSSNIISSLVGWFTNQAGFASSSNTVCFSGSWLCKPMSTCDFLFYPLACYLILNYICYWYEYTRIMDKKNEE